ncbi:DJ-1/PfpI family protein [Streptomyces sp. NPDC002088]|uniref:DJ-1/PfpI family protein n=1 Tax=Streptomyces sp. NPDC002088 TaxID=3154665 RepID=UPI003328C4C4
MAQRTVLVVLFDGVQSLDVTGPVEVFAGAEKHIPGTYRIRTASLDGAPVRTSSGLTLVPDGALTDVCAPHTLLLKRFGAEPTGERVVFDGKYVTAAGVSSGIDMGLTLLGRIAGDEYAQAVQLATEYDPQPPYDAGSPEKAPAHIVAELRARSRFILT